MGQSICASLSHTHYLNEVGMLKVPANGSTEGSCQSCSGSAVIGNPTGVFCEASRGSAGLTGITRVGVAVNGVIQEKAV